MRDRLIELLMQKGFGVEGATIAADHLIANNATIPPVSVGQTVYLIRSPYNREPFISEEVVERVRIEYTADGVLRKFGNRSFEAYDIDLGETVFVAREAAEQALKERSDHI